MCKTKEKKLNQISPYALITRLYNRLPILSPNKMHEIQNIQTIM